MRDGSSAHTYPDHRAGRPLRRGAGRRDAARSRVAGRTVAATIVPHNGTCRACMCRLVDGEIAYRVEWPWLTAEEKAEGWILPCVARAIGRHDRSAGGARSHAGYATRALAQLLTGYFWIVVLNQRPTIGFSGKYVQLFQQRACRAALKKCIIIFCSKFWQGQMNRDFND